MRFGVHMVLAAGKICTALLLGVASIGLLIPGGAIAFSQSSTGTAAELPLFVAIDLTPSGFSDSHAWGISGEQLVGYGGGPTTGYSDHALLWRASAASVVDLNPRGFNWSRTSGVCGPQQVGYGRSPATGADDHGRPYFHALLWRGSAASAVDLNPRGFYSSEAYGTSGTQQVGFGVYAGARPLDAPDEVDHALLWHGSAASAVDLHPRGFVTSGASGTDGEEQVGSGSPEGVFIPGSIYHAPHALLWHATAATVVDLHPSSGFTTSGALGVSGGQQVGVGDPTTGGFHALLWHGSAASVMDLHPRGFTHSFARSTNGEEQVGEGNPESGYRVLGSPVAHALLWRSSADSVTDLQAFLPPNFVSSEAWAIDAAGDIVGSASGPNLANFHAFLWKRNGPRPATSRHNTTGCLGI